MDARTPDTGKPATPVAAVSRDAAKVVETMAALLKESGIYPPEHPRVQERARAFAGEIESRIEAPNWLTVRVRGDAISVGRELLPAKSPLGQWMVGRLREAGLAGIEFGPKLDPSAAIEFARALAGCSLRQGRTFAKAWPENHPRIRPLELVFTGGHGMSPEAAAAPGAPGQAAGPGGTAAQDVWNRDLLARLAQQDGIATRLRSIEKIAEQVTGDAHMGREAGASIDLVASIVDLLPVEVARDPTRVDGVINDVLDAMQQSIAKLLRNGGEVRDADLLRAALGVARKYFGKSAGEAPVQQQVPNGRPEDERIVPDLQLLLAEVATLPDADVTLPPASACESSAPALARELCGIYLHVLQSSERHESMSALASALPKTLEVLGSEAGVLLDPYLGTGAGAFEAKVSDASRLRMLAFLQQLGHGALLRNRGYAEAGLFDRTFPDSLPVYARLLGTDAEGIDRLRKAIVALPSARLLSGAERLRQAGQLDAALVRTLVAVGTQSVLPLLQRAPFADDPALRTLVAEFLRGLELPAAESAALRGIEPSSELPARYVDELCRLVAEKGAGDQRLRQSSSHLLRAFVTDERRTLERRLAGIAMLRHVPGPETRATLQRLATTGRFTQFGAAARALRQRAREVLTWLEERGA